METILINKLATNYTRERRGLLRFIRARISNLRDAEDILQEVFVQALKHLNAMEPIDNLMAWLYTVAQNRIIDWYRRRKSGERFEQDLTEELFGQVDLDLLDIEDQEGLVENLYQAIEELPEPQKRVIVLQALHEMTFREIAEMECVSINTLLARKRQAIKYLRERLTDFQEK